VWKGARVEHCKNQSVPWMSLDCADFWSQLAIKIILHGVVLFLGIICARQPNPELHLFTQRQPSVWCNVYCACMHALSQHVAVSWGLGDTWGLGGTWEQFEGR